MGRIPSPMHSASRMPPQKSSQIEKMPVALATTVMQPSRTTPKATPVSGLNIQLPDQIFAPSPQMQDVTMAGETPQNGQYHSGVTWTEDVRCVTPSEAMQGVNRGCGTPVAMVMTPSNVATTHWRTMVCPMPPVKRRPLIPCLIGQQDGGNLTPGSNRSASMPSPANLWPSLPSTPVHSAAFSSLDADMRLERQKSSGSMSTDGSTPPLMTRQPFTRLFSM